MARGGGRDLPARERSPRQKPPETAHERKNLPRAETLPTAKASRHGAQAKGFAPQSSRSPRVPTNGGPLPTDEQPEKHPFGGVAPETAHERKDLPRAETLSSAKASRHGARAKGFAQRENALLGEGIPTRHTSERICPAQKHSPRRRPPDTAHEQKNLPRRGTLSSAKASRHGARAKGFAPAREHAPRRRPPDTAHERKGLPSGVRIRSACRRTAGRSRPTNSRKNTPSAGSHPRRCGRCRVHSH